MKRLDETVHKYGWMSSEYTCRKNIERIKKIDSRGYFGRI